MYKWPATFAGYQAVLHVNDDGRCWQGEVTVRPKPLVVVRLDAAAPLQGWVQTCLETQAMHLAYTTFDDSDGRYILTFDETPEATHHPRGGRICVHGGRMVSWYRLAEYRYTQISRSEPGQRRQVNTIERYELVPDGRLWASHYIMAYFREPDAVLLGMESYVNALVPLHGLLLPSRRSISYIDGGAIKTRVLELSAHQVLP
jgi:hypothetical protein